MGPDRRFRLANARLVCPTAVVEGDVLIRGEWIEALGAEKFDGKTVCCEGDFLLPGFVELHTDNFEHHLEPRSGTFLPPAIAIRAHDAELAAAGITTAFDALTLGGEGGGEEAGNGRPTLSSLALQAFAQSAADRDLRCEHWLHLRCEVSDIGFAQKLSGLKLARPPRVVSLMDHTPGQGQWRDLGRFRRHYGRRYGLDAAAIEALIERRQRAHLSSARSNRAHAAAFARSRNSVLASHDDYSLDDIASAKALGCKLSEFPTSALAAEAAQTRSMLVVAGAPNLVRGGSSSGNIAVAELVRQHTLHILSSDYYPASLLAAIFLLHQGLGVPLPEAVGMATLVPARAAGFHDRGLLVPGFLADLVRVRLEESGPVVVSVWRRGRRIF